MGYNDVISRSDAAALVPEEVSGEIIQNIAKLNPVMQLARKLPNMSTNQVRMPVMAALATAYFVSGDNSLKQTTGISWENKYINAEEIAAIVPIPEAVLNDVNYDIWGQVRPELERAFSVAISNAVIHGTNIPANWTTDLGAAGLWAGAVAAGNTVSLAAYTDLYEAILAEDESGNAGVFMHVEADGYMVTGGIASTALRGKLRGVRDANGQPIFKTSMQDATRYELEGTQLFFPTDGTMPSSIGHGIWGDWSNLVYSMRQDITYKLLTEAVIQDATGKIIYNLAQQDMVALRAVMRLGFCLPNPINRENQTAATRHPFAVLTA